MIALTLWLGNWQLNRAQEKRERQALLESRMNDNPLTLTAAGRDPQPLLYRRVRAAGRWLAARQFYVDNQIREGRAGFHVITPLELAPGPGVLLVNRVEVAGVATRPPARYLELSPQTVMGDVWQNLSIERFASASGLAVAPVVVLLESPPQGLAAVSEKPDAGVAKHIEYAFTWFALAATAFALWLALNLKREPR